ncbi:MAG: phage tail protein [Bacillota bacterium]
MEIFKLFGSIFIDSKEADKSLDSTDKKAEGLGTKLGGMIGTATKWGAAIGGAAIAGGAAMLGLANKTAETADFIDKLSERTGINREELQRWKYAAEQSGGDISKLEVGVKKLSEAMDGATNGSDANAKAFAKLGISMEDLQNKSQEQIFEEVMYALAEMPQGAERNALGNDLLGKSYTELMPLLNAGAEGMDALKSRADELGLVMSEDSVKAGVKFGDTLADLKSSFGAVFTHLGTEFIPIFQTLADWIIAHMPQIQATVKTVFDVINTVITTAYSIFKDNILPVLMQLFDWVMANMPQIKETAGTIFGAIIDVVTRLWTIFKENLLPIFIALYEFVEPTFPLIGSIIKGAFDIVIGIVNGVITVFERVTSAIKTAIDWIKSFNSTPVEDKTPKTGVNFIDNKKGKMGGVLGFDVGTNYVPRDMTANIHRGEMIVPAEFNPYNPNAKHPLGGGITVQVINPTVFNDRDADKLGNLIVGRLRTLGVAPQ